MAVDDDDAAADVVAFRFVILTERVRSFAADAAEAEFGVNGTAAALVGAVDRKIDEDDDGGGGVTDRQTRCRFDGDGCGSGDRDDDRSGGVDGRAFRFIAETPLTAAEPRTEAYDGEDDRSKHSEYDDHH